MATSQGFNQPRINYKKVHRRKIQNKRKVQGKPEAGARSKVAVSGVRTKKHARKQAHKEKCARLAAEEAARKAAEANNKSGSAAKEVTMKKIRMKKPKSAKKANGGQATMDTDMQE